jgi:acyl-CoA thioesterase-1
MGKLMQFVGARACAALLIAVSARAETSPASTGVTPEKKTIVFLGDSLSAGSGVQPAQAFPAVVGEKVRERGLPYEVVNAGVGGDTTAGGLRRLDWLLQRRVDVLILELGGNDGLRGLPVQNIRSNLQGMIDKAKAKYPDVQIVIAGMQMPPNVGAKYADDFKQVFFEVAKQNNVAIIPFLLEGVGGLREFNQPDLIHPNPVGHRMVAEVVWKTIEPLLKGA